MTNITDKQRKEALGLVGGYIFSERINLSYDYYYRNHSDPGRRGVLRRDVGLRLRNIRSLKIIISALEPRVVTREWSEEFLNAIRYCGRIGLMAGLQELGIEEVD